MNRGRGLDGSDLRRRRPWFSASAPLIILLSLTWLVLPAERAAAQFERAEIVGVVQDSTGGVLAGVTITAQNIATGIGFKATTDDMGNYVIPALRVGEYTVTAELVGFKKAMRTGVILQVNQRVRVDFKLDLGEIAETVEVEASAPLLEADTSSRGQVIDTRQITDLPLNGRSYDQLALLSVGVTRRSNLTEGAVNINGNRIFQNNYLLDGIDNNVVANNTRGETQFVQPSVDAVQEFKVQTSAYSAEFGRGAGGVVNVSLKSGTNEIHGSVYEFLRNEKLDAKNFFDPADEPIPPFKRNQFGFTIGGPIKRDRAFYFGDYEGLRIRQAQTFVSTVPNPARLTATGYDFSGKRQVFDPATTVSGRRQPFPNNFIPIDRIDPRALKLLAIYPAPNIPGREDLSNNFVFNPVWTTRDDRFDVRVDHQLSDSWSSFYRYSFRDVLQNRPGVLPGLGEGGGSTAFSKRQQRAQNLALGYTTTITPRLLNDFRFGWARVAARFNPLNGGNPSELTGIPNLPSDPIVIGGLPRFDITGVRSLGRRTFVPQFQIPHVLTFKDTLSIVRGRHSLKAGVEFRKTWNQYFDQRATIGNFTFNGSFTQDPANRGRTGEGLADFLLFLPDQARLTSPAVFTHGSYFIYTFLQDDWKATPNLTVNWGLRYELGTPLREEANRFANFDPEARRLVRAEPGSITSRALVDLDKNNFAPRLGLAYSFGNRLVLRAAYGVFYNLEDRRGSESILSGNPPFTIDLVLNSDRLTRPAVNLSAGFPPDTLDPSRVSLANVLLRVQDRNQRSAYVQQWNLSLQYEFLRNTLLDVGYVGNKGTKLPALRNLNQALPGPGSPAGRRTIPGFGDIQWLENRDSSNYHSMQLRIESRARDDLFVLASYTLGKAINGATENLARSGGFERNPQNSFNLRAERGPAEFDVRHNFVLAYNYALPFGRGKRFGADWHGLANSLLGNWQINGIASIRSGFAMNVTIASGLVPNLGGERAPRPDLVANPALPESQRTIQRWFNTAAFAVPSGTFGNAGRGILYGPEAVNFDFSVFKNFIVAERMTVQFRTEFFNLFNHPNFDPPDAVMGAAGFGAISSAQPSRQIQFALKLLF